MKLLIIEDETTAFNSLKEQLAQLIPTASIEPQVQSIDEAIEYFENNPMPNLVFMDIHLADGSAFNIFKSVNISCPIIFTTAYDQYALKAFEVNSIDYLLKPINPNHLHRALDKFQNILHNDINHLQIEKLLETIHLKKNYKKNLIVQFDSKQTIIDVNQIIFIYLETQVIKLITSEGKIYFLNDTLEEVYRQLDPQQFYRANRQQIINRSAIKEISTWLGYKVLVTLNIEVPQCITISKGRAAEFKKWLKNDDN